MKTDSSHFTLIIRKKKNKRRERGERDVRKGRRRKKKKRLKSKRKARQWPGNLAEGSRADPAGLAAQHPGEQGEGAHIPAGVPSCSFLARRVSRIQGARLSGDLRVCPAPPPSPAGSRAGARSQSPTPSGPRSLPLAASLGSASPNPQRDFSLLPRGGILGGAAAPTGRSPPPSTEAGAAPGPRGARPDAARRQGSST